MGVSGNDSTGIARAIFMRPVSEIIKKLLNPKLVLEKILRDSHAAYWDWRFGGWCGGRHESALAHLGLHGAIEIDDELARVVRQRLKRFANVTILTGDALALLPAHATKFYLWNPFSGEVLQRLKDRLLEVYGQRGNVTVIYYYSLYLSVFEGDPNWTIQKLDPKEMRLIYPSAIIRMKSLADAR